MARRRYRRKRPVRKRRRFRKKTKRSVATVNTNYADLRKCRAPIPRIMRNVLKYQDYVQTDASTTANLSHIWRINDNYDIDQTATGGQPPCRDDLYNFYFTSRVNNATVRYTVNNKNTRAFKVHFVLQDSTTDYGDASTYNLVGLPGYMGSLNVGSNQNGSAAIRTKRLKINVMKALKKLVYPESYNFGSSLWGTSGTSPSRILYLVVYTQYLDQDATGSALYDYDISIWQDTTWSLQLSTPVAAFD